MLRRHRVKLRFTKEMLNLPGPIKKIGLIAAIYTLGWAIIDPFFFIYLKQLFGNYAYVGLITAVLYLFAILWSLPLGQLVNRVSEKILLLTTLTIFLPMGYFLITIKTFTQFFFLRVYNSFTAASIWVSLEDYVREHSDKRTAYEAFGLFDTLCSLSYVIGPIIGALLLMKFGFSSFIVVSITGFLALLITLTLKDHKKEGMMRGIREVVTKDKFIIREFKDFIKNKKMVRIELFSFIYIFATSSLAMLLPLFLNEQKASYLQIGIISSLYYLPLISESYFSTLKQKNKLITRSMIVLVILLIMISLTTSIWILFLLVAALSLCSAAITSVIRGKLTNCIPKKECGELSGMDMSLKYAAAGLGLLLSGIAAQIFGLGYVFLIMAIVLALLLLLTSKKEFKF